MCGICGIYHFSGKRVDKESLVAMRDIMIHRGPDGEGLFLEKNVGLGHRRLSIIDISGGAQPMFNEDGSIVLVLNGEIYNYLELKEDLKKRNHVFKTYSDAEVVLHLYEEYGQNFLPYLNGMYAFALYDKRKKRLFMARDPFGIKPLYYKRTGEGLLFASEIKALLQYPGERPCMDKEALMDYLTFQYVLGEKTFFKNIKKILPGHMVVINNSEFSMSRFWDLPAQEETNLSEGECQEALLLALKDSVRIQLRSDVPVGSYLSGGIDTSSIVCLASRHLGYQLKTFTAGFKEGGVYDDTEFARVTSRYADTRHYEIFPTSADFSNSFDKIIWHLDEPVAAQGIFPQYMVSRLASENVKVALGGQGADEIIGGYTRYYLLYLERLLQERISGVKDKSISSFPLEGALSNISQLTRYIPLLHYFFKENLFGPVEERYFRLICRCENLNSILSEEFLQDSKNYSPFESFLEVFKGGGYTQLLNRVLRYETKAWLPALLQVEDRVSMACSLESRVPFLDTRIAQLIFGMPVSIKFKNGQTKSILRKTVKGIIPDAIDERKDKIGFPVPLFKWLKNDLNDFLHERVGDTCCLNGIFKPAAIHKIIEGSREFDRDVWGIMCLESWYRQFFL
ncbi:MAG: asparagine synthase (glutamine-hydrolyzing) [Candidatus Omnitrophota bacterium]|nr:MAG: asparagine synthase (glutamine-hydrolyzing) [Candidatus Omnitrophota bacterium]